MYRIYADDTLIYDSTIEDYKIGKGQITKEAEKSGSFVFSVYPDHPYYDRFIQMRTVITVLKSGRIAFRGRVLDDSDDYWNTKDITCEGELSFLRDSVVRPFSFQGSHAELFAQFIENHNAQVDEFKRFKVGTVTVEDENDYINRSGTDYGNTFDSMKSALTDSELGGYFYITHGDDGTDPIPTLNWVADYPKTASQGIEFGVNLKNYTKKVTSTDLATCIIPLGTSNSTTGGRLTIADVNGGKDYLEDPNAVAMFGRIIKPIVWEDVTLANHLLTKGKAQLQTIVNQHATIELTAVDMHLLDRSIESYNVCEYVRATSAPHSLDALMLCTRQTMDLLKPDNDTVTLGYNADTLTAVNVKLGASISAVDQSMTSIKQDATNIELQVQNLSKSMGQTLRIAEDGVTIVNADGSTLTIDGGQINAEGLTVEAANINGTLKASQIDATNLKVAAANVTGAITWEQMDEEVQGWIENAGSIAEDAEAVVNEITYTYQGSTYIDENCIMAGTVIAGSLQGGEVALLDANENEAGGIILNAASSADYALELYSGGALRLTADDGAVYIVNSGGEYFTLDEGEAWVNCNFRPNGDNRHSLGVPGAVWSTVYAESGTVETSDKNKKKDIVYDLSGLDGFFDDLKPADYRFVDGTSGRRHRGFVAQDVLANLQKHGISTADFAGYVEGKDKDGNPTYGLRYSEFIPLLVEQVQTLKARVAELEARKK